MPMAQEKELSLDAGDDAEGGKSRGRSKLVVILLALLVLLGGGGAVGYFLMSGSSGSSKDEAVEEIIQPSQYLTMKPAFIANYLVGKRQHYLQAEMTLVTRDQTKLTVFNDHMPLIQSAINVWLNQQDFEELRDPETREPLRQILVEHLQLKLEEETGESGLEDILFTGFVMQ
jgi:flagellar FliL protein